MNNLEQVKWIQKNGGKNRNLEVEHLRNNLAIFGIAQLEVGYSLKHENLDHIETFGLSLSSFLRLPFWGSMTSIVFFQNS